MSLRTCFFPTSTQSVSSKHISWCTTCSHHHCKETAGNWKLPYGAVWSSDSYRNQLTSWRSHQETHKFCCKDIPGWSCLLPVFPGELGVWTLQFTFETNDIYRWTHGHFSLDVATSTRSRLVLDICFGDNPFNTLHEMAQIPKTVDWKIIFIEFPCLDWGAVCFFLRVGSFSTGAMNDLNSLNDLNGLLVVLYIRFGSLIIPTTNSYTKITYYL